MGSAGHVTHRRCKYTQTWTKTGKDLGIAVRVILKWPFDIYGMVIGT
jgi:hypothetical protein